MMTLLSPHFKLEEVSEDDMVIASLAWGFTLGFGWLTVWTAIKQTTAMYRRQGDRIYRNSYIWMIWLEILVCTIFSIICWLHLKGIIPPSFAFYFCILTTWALQVQFLLQIIINRCAILLTNQKRAWRLKVGVAVLITAINISVYNIWVPARLQISERYIEINEWWDRCEKVIYLIVDGALNIYFVRIVQKNLVTHGLTKYKRLTQFNMFIIGFSLSMDVLIIAMMSLNNTFVYMQFHPLAYMVKLKIEMSMAELIGKVARKRDLGILSAADFNGNNRDSYQPSEYSLQLPTYARGRPVGGIDATISSQPPNPIELNNVTKPKVPALRGVNVAAVSSGPSSRRPSIGAANATDADGQPKMAIYRTREVVVEIERVPPNQGHQPSTSQASQLTLDDSFDITNFEDDSSIKGLSAAQKSLALPNIQAPWATQEFSTKIWDGTNCDEDPTLPTTIAKIGSWPKDT
ncbi:hypothetical protein HER10_EVM0003248 [Colletotrichum scovillei]|uniref:Integral membrane protein n=1 Tax=Colletotrichum scovillei TaxID=1209932 RepID=A0A9P7QWZ0_9PEZI|nr:uncharacterized protein HER10_EVM0003248 [Colletotrichum scovillei]KAF4784033.1 hypothetical protein HER10_EVM0003248 [Colletotrichum scovillei]KAG7044959.1 hypothetical protein JMJ77_0004417 [Colletotrichum scovillei]KAG7049672.1 hypothetical protein JMJ78_0013651 [Colletotrichum scovillei]KAG7064412.1 hypothetical protein JMJ76_0007456 [Colletotrichum scovillei]